MTTAEKGDASCPAQRGTSPVDIISGEVTGFTGEVYLALERWYITKAEQGRRVMPRAAGYVARR